MLLIGCLDSPFVRRVAVSLHHYGFEFRRQPLLTFGHFDAVLKTNPLGKVPAMVLDDGQVLIDSSYILDHFDRLAAPERALTPSSGAGRTEVQQTVAVALGLAEKSVEYRTETIRRPAGKVHADAVERVARQIQSALEWLQRRVQRCANGHLVLARLTQADVTTAIAVTNLRHKNAELLDATRFDALLRWSERIEELPALRAAPFTMEG
jgi:glutathione S-transferase